MSLISSSENPIPNGSTSNEKKRRLEKENAAARSLQDLNSLLEKIGLTDEGIKSIHEKAGLYDIGRLICNPRNAEPRFFSLKDARAILQILTMPGSTFFGHTSILNAESISSDILNFFKAFAAPNSRFRSDSTDVYVPKKVQYLDLRKMSEKFEWACFTTPTLAEGVSFKNASTELQVLTKSSDTSVLVKDIDDWKTQLQIDADMDDHDSTCQLDESAFLKNFYSRHLKSFNQLNGGYGVLCYLCVIASRITPGEVPALDSLAVKKTSLFVSEPCLTVSRLSSRLTEHAETILHQKAVQLLAAGPGPLAPLAVLHRVTLLDFMKPLYIVCHYLMSQNIAFRGDQEATISQVHSSLQSNIPLGFNTGNFIQLLLSIGELSPEVRKFLLTGDVLYLSPFIQKRVCHAIGEVSREKNFRRVKKGMWYFLMIDESADASMLNQLIVTLRFYDVDSKCVREIFIAFIHLKGTAFPHSPTPPTYHHTFLF